MAATYDTSNPLAGILNTILGTELEQTTDTTGSSSSNTNQTNNTNQSGTSTSNTSGQSVGINSGQSNTSGSNSSQTAFQNQGVQSQVGVNASTSNTNSSTNTQQSQNQQITGTTNTTGTTSSNNTTQTVTDTESRHQGFQQTSADIEALKQILARQMAGITPQMLAAIFEQGSREAPQLLATQANALGARAGSNTPLAAALNMLNTNMTNKAADINLQMLRDAMTSASKVGDLTKRIDEGSSDNSHTTQTVTQSGTTTSAQQQVMNQLVQGLTNTVSNTSSTTDTLGATNMLTQNVNQGVQSTQGTNNSSTNSNNVNTNFNNSTTTGATNQNTNQTVNTNTNATNQSTVNVNQQTTINRDVVKGLAAGVAGVLGIQQLTQLYNAAKAAGFIGPMEAFVKGLKDEGVDVSGYPMEGDAYSPQDLPGGVVGNEDIIDETLWNSGIMPDDPVDLDINTDIIDLPPGGLADGGMIDTDSNGIVNGPLNIAGMLNDPNTLISALLGATTGNTINKNGSTGSKSDNAASARQSSLPAPEKKVDVSTAAPEYATWRSTGDAESENVMPNNTIGALVPFGTSRWEGGDAGGEVQQAPQGYIKRIAEQGDTTILDVYDTDGNFLRRETQKKDNFMKLVDMAIPMLASAFIPGAKMVMGAGAVDSAANTGDIAGMLKGLVSMGSGAMKIPGGKADGGVIQNPSAAEEKKELAGAPDDDNDEPHDRMLKMLGITRLPTPGTYQVTHDTLRLVQHAIKGQTAMADGGKIQGPGTGISDSIPAVGPGNQPLRVANGEYVVPADVVQKLGVDFFDHLRDKYHVPADMQRAMGLE